MRWKMATQDVVVMVVGALVTVSVLTLAQKPAARSLLAMRLAHGARVFCQAQADLWAGLAAHAATAYNRARL